MKMKHEKVKGLIEALTAAVRARGEQTSGAAP
jgi:hypothetical protein